MGKNRKFPEAISSKRLQELLHPAPQQAPVPVLSSAEQAAQTAAEEEVKNLMKSNNLSRGSAEALAQNEWVKAHLDVFKPAGVKVTKIEARSYDESVVLTIKNGHKTGLGGQDKHDLAEVRLSESDKPTIHKAPKGAALTEVLSQLGIERPQRDHRSVRYSREFNF